MAFGHDLGGAGKMSNHAQAMDELLALPHVARVGFGFKETPEGVKAEWAYRIYVEWPTEGTIDEQISAANAAFDAMPKKKGSVPIDTFFEMPRPLHLSGQPPLVPGAKASVHYLGTGQPVGFGTIGAIVENGGKRFILTAGHVLREPRIPTFVSSKAPGVDIYVPERDVSLCTRKIVATSYASSIHCLEKPPIQALLNLDGGLAEIASGMKSGNQIAEDAGGPLLGTLRDLIPFPDDAPPAGLIEVWKKGARTGLTRGVVVEFFSLRKLAAPPPKNSVATWTLEIKPTAGYAQDYFLYVKKLGADDYELGRIFHMFRNRPVSVTHEGETAGSIKIRVQGQWFALEGDSGSGIYDTTGNLLGLLTGSQTYTLFDAAAEDGRLYSKQEVTSEPSAGSYIKPLFTHFGLPDNALVAPGAPQFGELLGVPDVAIGVPPPSWSSVEARLGGSSGGRRVLALSRRHLEEVRQLVHHNRRVMVVWHRSKAAAFAAILVGIFEGTRRTLPLEVDGTRAHEALSALLQVLEGTGSAPLRTAIAQHRSWVLDVICDATSLPEMLERIERARLDDDREVAA